MMDTAPPNLYAYEELHFEDPAFKTIKRSYLITMIGSLRRDSYMAQLQEFRPTETVVIVHNVGFRHGQKPNVNTTAQDLWHVNSTIMRLQEESDEAILVLEDDVIFRPAFPEFAPRIEAFLLQHPRVGMYNLGGMPLLSLQTTRHSMRTILCGFAHAVIYTQTGRNTLVDRHITGLHDLACSFWAVAYVASIPLAVQRISRTENSKLWDCGGCAFGYLTCFGDHLFDAHHGLGRIGGLFGVVLELIVVLVVSVAVCYS